MIRMNGPSQARLRGAAGGFFFPAPETTCPRGWLAPARAMAIRRPVFQLALDANQRPDARHGHTAGS
jgi:hypothetical protein